MGREEGRKRGEERGRGRGEGREGKRGGEEERGGRGESTREGHYLDGIDVSLSDNKFLDAEELSKPRPLVDCSQRHCLICVQTLTKF